MPVFSYKASDPTGKVVTGSLEASDEKTVVAILQEKGNIPIRISQGSNGQAVFSTGLGSSKRSAGRVVEAAD